MTRHAKRKLTTLAQEHTFWHAFGHTFQHKGDLMDKVRENRLRRIAERQGLALQKSRRRDRRAIDFGGYMLVDPTSNTVVYGSEPYAFSADMDDVEEFLSKPD